MASRDRAVTVQRLVLVVLAVALLTLAVVAGVWAGDRRRDADRSAARVVIAEYPVVRVGAQLMRKV